MAQCESNLERFEIKLLAFSTEDDFVADDRIGCLAVHTPGCLAGRRAEWREGGQSGGRSVGANWEAVGGSVGVACVSNRLLVTFSSHPRLP